MTEEPLSVLEGPLERRQDFFQVSRVVPGLGRVEVVAGTRCRVALLADGGVSVLIATRRVKQELDLCLEGRLGLGLCILQL